MKRMTITFFESTDALSADHLEISMPNGARYMPAIPMNMKTASFGRRYRRPCMSSRLRLCRQFSVAPTSWNIRDFEMAWNIIRNTPAQIVSGLPIPAQATISPRFEIVEYARTFFASTCPIAMIEVMKKVNPPIPAMK